MHVPLDGEPGRRVVPRQRQPHGARRHAQLVGRGQRVLDPLQQRQQRPRGQPRGVGVDLQRPDAGREVDDPGQALGRQRLLQRVHPHPQAQVEDGIAVLDDHVVVAVPAVDHGRARPCPPSRRARMPSSPSPPVRASAGVARRSRRDGRVRLAHRHEAHGVARPKLAHLPQLAARDDRRADEPAEARPVRAEDDRRVAGEVERADRVGHVVDVGRVQPGLAAVLACPRRARPDEPDAGARRVVVHGVAAGVQLVDVGPGEELRCRVRSLGDPDLPVRHDRGPPARAASRRG